MIVVDTSPFFHGPMLATLDRTDELLLVCALDVPTLKNVRLALQTLELLSFPTERIQIVLNRAQLEGRDEAKRGRERARASRSASRSRATAPCRSRSTAATRRCSATPRAGFSRPCARWRRPFAAGAPTRRERPPLVRQGGVGRMGLHDRIKGPNGNGANGNGRRAPSRTPRWPPRAPRDAGADRSSVDPYAELKTRDPPRLHRQARPASSSRGGADGRPVRPVLRRGDRAARARPDAADARGAPADHARDRRRHPRLRAARAVPARRHRDRGHGQRLRPDLRRAGRAGSSARTRRLRRRRAPAAHHRQDRLRRSAAASTSRRRWSTPACPTAAA